MKRSGFIRRRTRLKSASTKRRKRNAEVRDFRQSLKEEIGACELCEQVSNVLDCHEIAGGWARGKAMGERFAILVLCRGCHEFIEQNHAYGPYQNRLLCFAYVGKRITTWQQSMRC